MTRTRTLATRMVGAVLSLATVVGAESAVTAAPQPSDAELLSRAFVAAAETAAPAVVSIHVTRTLKRDDTETSASGAGLRDLAAREAGGSPYFRPRDIDGSGLVWSPEGEIVTAQWNIGKAVEAIAVTLADGSVHEAVLVGLDEIHDVALLQLVDPPGGLPTLEHAHPDARPGQLVVAVGRSLASRSHTASTGVVSALNRRPGEEFLGAIQHSARVNFANIGCPLVDIQGRLLALTVGLNSNPTLNPAGLNSGVGFAVPTSTLENLVEKLRGGLHRERPEPLGRPGPDTPFVGVNLEDDIHGRGVLITRVTEDSAASRGGLLNGDLILEFAGVPVLETRKLQRAIRAHAIGDEVDLLIERDGTEQTITIKLGKRP